MNPLAFASTAVRAFFSRDLYRDVALLPAGRTAAYLFLLLALCWLAFAVNTYRELGAYMADEWPELVRQIPAISVRGGQVSVAAEQPVFIRKQPGGEVLAIIDTTGQYRSLEGVDARILLTGSRVILKRSEVETRIYDLAQLEDFYLDAPTLEEWGRRLARWVPLVLYPFLLMGSFVYRLLQGVLYAVLALGLARVLRRPLHFPQVFNLALVALTPAVILSAVASTFTLQVPYLAYACFVITLGYLCFAVSATPAGAPASPPAADA